MTVRAYHTWNQMPRQDGFPDGSVSVTVDFPVESAARPIRYLLVERKTQGRQATEAQILIFLGSLRPPALPARLWLQTASSSGVRLPGLVSHGLRRFLPHDWGLSQRNFNR